MNGINKKAMNFNNFTLKSQESVQAAQQYAFENEHQHIENEHLLRVCLKFIPMFCLIFLKNYR